MCTTNRSSPYITAFSQGILDVETITSRGSSRLLSYATGVEMHQGQEPYCRGRWPLIMSTLEVRGLLLVHDGGPSDLFLECNHLRILLCR